MRSIVVLGAWPCRPRRCLPSPPNRARAISASPSTARPGRCNAITDVAGVESATHADRRRWQLEVGKGPVRTGVTAILPRGKARSNDPVFAGWFALNGNGEMTGTAWIEESGFLEGPV